MILRPTSKVRRLPARRAAALRALNLHIAVLACRYKKHAKSTTSAGIDPYDRIELIASLPTHTPSIPQS